MSEFLCSIVDIIAESVSQRYRLVDRCYIEIREPNGIWGKLVLGYANDALTVSIQCLYHGWVLTTLPYSTPEFLNQVHQTIELYDTTFRKSDLWLCPASKASSNIVTSEA